MTTIKKILCAIDLTKASRNAFDRALSIRSREQRQALHPSRRTGHPGILMASERTARTSDPSARAGGTRRRPVRTVEQQGDPAEIIVLHANARKADLGRPGIQPAEGVAAVREGSVGERVLRRAAWAVLIVLGTRLREDPAHHRRHTHVVLREPKSDVGGSGSGTRDGTPVGSTIHKTVQIENVVLGGGEAGKYPGMGTGPAGPTRRRDRAGRPCWASSHARYLPASPPPRTTFSICTVSSVVDPRRAVTSSAFLNPPTSLFGSRSATCVCRRWWAGSSRRRVPRDDQHRPRRAADSLPRAEPSRNRCHPLRRAAWAVLIVPWDAPSRRPGPPPSTHARRAPRAQRVTSVDSGKRNS